MRETASDERERTEVATPTLVSVVVEHDDSPDKCTIFPPDASGVRRMSTWITTEREQLVDLGTVR